MKVLGGGSSCAASETWPGVAAPLCGSPQGSLGAVSISVSWERILCEELVLRRVESREG